MRLAGHVARIGEEIGVYRVLVGNLKERDHSEDPGIDGRIILGWIFRKLDVGCGVLDCIGLAQDTDGWRAILNAVMDIRVQYRAGNFMNSFKPVSFSRRTLLSGVSK
jgi:hypothetical protein